MKKILRYFVILLTTSTIGGKNNSLKSEKTNEIYFTITKERQANGISKIRIVFPLENVKENGILKDNFYLEEEKTDKPESPKNEQNFSTNKESNPASLLLSGRSSLKSVEANEKDVNKSSSENENQESKTDFATPENSPLRLKKEIGKDVINKFASNDYRFHDPLTGSYRFGYKTQHQYREEIRSEDGTVRGNFGWVDENGKWHHTVFISDKYGYRTNSPDNIINSYHSSNIPVEPLASGTQKESTYISYNKEKDSNKRKVTRLEDDSGRPRNRYPEESFLTNIKDPVPSSGPTKEGEDNNSTYLSYIRTNTNLNEEQSQPQKNTQSFTPNVNPTKIPDKLKPTTHETITVTNLQDKFFNKLPLKPQKDKVSPPLDKPLKMYSDYISKWPDMSWPKPPEPDLKQILGGLQGLSGRSNSFIESEPDFQADHSTLHKPKIAKSIYDSPVSKNLNSGQENKNIKRARSETTNNRLQSAQTYSVALRNDNFNPTFVDTSQTGGYNLLPLQLVPNKQTSMNIPFDQVFGRNYILIIPVYFGWYHYHPFQYMNIANPNHQFSTNYIKPLLKPIQAPNFLKVFNSKQDFLSSNNMQILFDNQNKKTENESSEDEDSKDYLLLSDEFQEINGSITNDPAFENIQNLFADTNESKVSQNFTFEEPINILESNLSTISQIPLDLSEMDDSDENDDKEEIDHDNDDNENSDEYDDYGEQHEDDDDDDDDLNLRLNTFIREESNTHKEITFRLSTPLIRNSFPVLLKEHKKIK